MALEPQTRQVSERLRPRRERWSLKRRILLAFGALFFCAVAFFIVVLLTDGADGLVRFFTEPSLEAKSGRKFTPFGAVKRYFEKLGESQKTENP